MQHRVLVPAFVVACAAARVVAAQPEPTPVPAPADQPPAPATKPAPVDVKSEIPLTFYTQTAFGASPRTAGAAGFGTVVGGATAEGHSTETGGGGRVWFAPIDRLTMLVEVDRRPFGGGAAPSVTGALRLLGNRDAGWALGGLVSYRTEGFAELPGEIETAALLSFVRGGFHTDANFVFGTAVEERENDGEVKLRLGYDVTSFLRLGLDGRFRYRLSGDKALPGERRGDAVAGPEAVFGYKNVFLAIGGGASTVGIATQVGWTATGAVGGALL